MRAIIALLHTRSEIVDMVDRGIDTTFDRRKIRGNRERNLKVYFLSSSILKILPPLL